MTEDEMTEVGWHHQLDGHEFEQAVGLGDGGQGSLVCCSPWGRKELDTTEQQTFRAIPWQCFKTQRFKKGQISNQTLEEGHRGLRKITAAPATNSERTRP